MCICRRKNHLNNKENAIIGILFTSHIHIHAHTHTHTHTHIHTHTHTHRLHIKEMKEEEERLVMQNLSLNFGENQV